MASLRRRLRIAVLNWRDIASPLAGGAEVHAHEIFSRIARMGHDVTIFSTRFPDCVKEEHIDGVRILRSGTWFNANYASALLYLRRSLADPPDVVVDDINKVPFLAPLYCREPVVAIVHHLFREVLFEETNWFAAQYVNLFERLIPRVYHSAPIIVVSESTAEDLASMGLDPGRITVIHNGIDRTLYFPDGSVPGPSPTLAVVARLKRYKNVADSIRAMQGIVREFSRARMVVVGEGGERPFLESLVSQLSLGEHVTFTGHVSQAEKVRILQRSHLLVNTSLKEGWGLVNIEANACGAPVVAYDSLGIRDSVTPRSGRLVPRGDADRLSEEVVALLRDEAERRRLASGALEWARSFDWESAACRTLEVIERAARGRRQGGGKP